MKNKYWNCKKVSTVKIDAEAWELECGITLKVWELKSTNACESERENESESMRVQVSSDARKGENIYRGRS